jgi:hypothetical protein
MIFSEFALAMQHAQRPSPRQWSHFSAR